MAKALIGILLDVSDSMHHNAGSGIDEDGGPWARSIFKVVDNLIEHDVPSDNHVFTLAFGAKAGGEVFDILMGLQSATNDQIEEIFKKLETAGAR